MGLPLRREDLHRHHAAAEALSAPAAIAVAADGRDAASLPKVYMTYAS